MLCSLVLQRALQLILNAWEQRGVIKGNNTFFGIHTTHHDPPTSDQNTLLLFLLRDSHMILKGRNFRRMNRGMPSLTEESNVTVVSHVKILVDVISNTTSLPDKMSIMLLVVVFCDRIYYGNTERRFCFLYVCHCCR